MATEILASNRGRINVPSGPFLDERGNITPAWRIWLLNPNVQSLQAAAPLEPYSGGLGVSTAPVIGQLPVATSTGVYIPSAFTSLPLFTSTSPGLAPASGGGTVNFLRADGTYADPKHIIQDEGTPLAQRPAIDFVGIGVTVTDSPTKTIVTIPGGGGGSLDDIIALQVLM